MEYVPCIGNSSYSFWRILLKLYRCFKDGLKICILFFQNPEIIFYHFLRIFNLDIFRALILQICIWSMYLVSATPPTVFGESFWNLTDVLRMVWRYAYCFFRILKLFFITFFTFLTFEPLYYRYVYGVYTLYRQLLLQFLANPFETLQLFSGWSEDMHIVFSGSWNYFFLHFNLDIFSSLYV